METHRLKIISGHIDAINRMLEEEKPDIKKALFQIKAVKGALRNFEHILLKEYLEKASNDKMTKAQQVKLFGELLDLQDITL